MSKTYGPSNPLGVNALTNLCDKNKKVTNCHPCLTFKDPFVCLFTNLLDRVLEMAVKHHPFYMHCVPFITCVPIYNCTSSQHKIHLF